MLRKNYFNTEKFVEFYTYSNNFESINRLTLYFFNERITWKEG